MRLNLKYCLMIVLLLIILYYSLGDMLLEGFGHHDSDNLFSEQHINTPKNDLSRDLNVEYTDNLNANYNEDLPNTEEGIPASQIPIGNEDLYILKSQIVPPVCPACPPVLACDNNKKCQPCPPCARCPEPAFECKKVPNYQSTNNSYLPRPMLNSFSQF